MISKWASLSMVVIILNLLLLCQLYYLNLFCWIFLELFNWALFFLFFLDYSKSALSLLYLYFLLQTSCRFIWILSVSVLFFGQDMSTLFTIIVILTLLVKLGLFPGHLWGLYIYNSTSLPVVLALSSFMKLTPLLLLLKWSSEVKRRDAELVLFLCVIMSYFIVFLNLWVSRNLFSFVFFSRMFHFSNLIILLTVNLVEFCYSYLIIYLSVLLIFRAIYSHFKVSSFQGSSNLNRGPLVLYVLALAGFPPTPLFWFKLFFLYKIWGFGLHLRVGTLVILPVLFIYFITLFIYVRKSFNKHNRFPTGNSHILPYLSLICLPFSLLPALL